MFQGLAWLRVYLCLLLCWTRSQVSASTREMSGLSFTNELEAWWLFAVQLSYPHLKESLPRPVFLRLYER